MKQLTKWRIPCKLCGSELDIEDCLFGVCEYCDKMQSFREKEESIDDYKTETKFILEVEFE